MDYDDVHLILIEEFPEIVSLIDDDDFELPYITAFLFVKYMLEAYKNGNKETYKKGLDFIERLHLSEAQCVRELATVGYLESLHGNMSRDYIDLGILYNDLGEETKKWWIELDRFWGGKIKYLGETYPI